MMKRMLFVLLLAAPLSGVASEPKGNAGVIPYACVNGQALILLAFDPYPGRKGWGAFGGGPGWGETISETAAREFHEETNCAFAPLDLTGKSYSVSNKYYTYFAQVTYQPGFRIAAHQGRCRDVERNSWLWVQHTDLVSALEQGSDEVRVPAGFGEFDRVPLWHGAKRSLVQALKDRVLPPSLHCSNPP